MLAFSSLDDNQQEAIRWGFATKHREVMDALYPALSRYRSEDKNSEAAKLEALALYYDRYPKKLEKIVSSHRRFIHSELDREASDFANGDELERMLETTRGSKEKFDRLLELSDPRTPSPSGRGSCR